MSEPTEKQITEFVTRCTDLAHENIRRHGPTRGRLINSQVSIVFGFIAQSSVKDDLARAVRDQVDVAIELGVCNPTET